MQRVLELVFWPTSQAASGKSVSSLRRRLAAHPRLSSVHGETAQVELELHHCEAPPSDDPDWRCLLLQARSQRFAAAVHDFTVLPGVRVRSWEPVSLHAGQPPDFGGQCGDVPLRASFERHWWRVDLDGEPATVSLDTGYLSGPAISGGDGKTRAFTELRLSLELADVDNPSDAGPRAGTATDAEQRVALAAMAVRLFELALSLNDDGTFHLVGRDALTCAMEPLSEAQKAGAIEFGHARTLVSAASAAMQNVFEQWLTNAAGIVGSTGSEYVHQMRIALRRMRVAYRIFDMALREAGLDANEDELKWIGGLLGDLRDWDVLVEGTFPALVKAAAMASAPSEHPSGAGAAAPHAGALGEEQTHERTQASRAWERALAEVVKRREAVADTLRAAVNSPRYAALVMHTARQLAILTAASADRRATPLDPFGRKTLRKRYRRLMKVKDIQELPPRARHQLRIHAKRLRYAVEFLAPALDRKARRRMAQRTSDLQEALGIANDAVVGRQFLSQLDLPPLVQAFSNGYLSALEASATSGGAEQFEKIREKKT